VIDLTRWEAKRNNRRAAEISAALLVLLAIAITPYARIALPAAPPFMPAVVSASVVAEAITAFLLFSQYRTTRSVPLAYLGCAYAFAAIAMLAYLLTYPGAFAEDGLLGAGPQTSGWIWLCWHYGFLLLVLRYLQSRAKFELADNTRIRRYVGVVIGAAILVVIATIVWHDNLPASSTTNGEMTPLWRYFLVPSAIALALAALFMLVRLTRLLSVVDLWVAVAVLATAGDVYLILAGAGRYSLGWYAARTEVLVAGFLVLFIFLYQIDHMYRELAQVTERLVEQALIDGLTEVSNRRAFDQHIKSVVSMSARRKAPMAVIMMDIDHFKLYNDSFGHIAGDECLRKVAAIIRSQLKRPYDFLARFGGEEFVAVLSDVDKSGALTVAEKIRAAVADAQITHSNESPLGCVTLSLGINSLTAKPTSTVGEVMEPADHALYLSKKNGRNCFTLAGSEAAVSESSAAS
jgi:diguanylate cyclase (GGDEF)-like protein